MAVQEIKFIKHQDINREKWDRCVAESANARIYALSWYLDIVCPDWQGLVWDDYEYVMPLPVKRKLGMEFLLQPIFAQQHGIFPIANTEIQNNCLTAIYNRFRYIDINVNASHQFPFPETFTVVPGNNYVLNLNRTYNELIKSYSKHTRRQLKKANDNKLLIIKGLQPKEYLDLKISSARSKIRKRSMQTLENLIEFGIGNGSGMIYAAYNQNNQICAAAFFIIYKQRAIYLNAFSTEEGKNVSAMYLIVNQFITENSEKSLILDFEGSNIHGIARFYAGFDAVPEQYHCLKSNRLPIPFRWVKK